MDRQRLNQIGKSVFGLFDFEGANEIASSVLRANYAELIVVAGETVATQMTIYIAGLDNHCFVYISLFHSYCNDSAQRYQSNDMPKELARNLLGFRRFLCGL